jgi:hypothetical protein
MRYCNKTPYPKARGWSKHKIWPASSCNYFNVNPIYFAKLLKNFHKVCCTCRASDQPEHSADSYVSAKRSVADQATQSKYQGAAIDHNLRLEQYYQGTIQAILVVIESTRQAACKLLSAAKIYSGVDLIIRPMDYQHMVIWHGKEPK